DCHFRSNLSFGHIGRDYINGKSRYSHNRIALENSPSLAMEMQISNIEVDHNYITGTRNGGVSSSNNPATWHASSVDSRFRSPHGDWHVHHNVIETSANQGFGFAAGLYGAVAWPLHNILIENETVVFNTTSGQAVFAVIVANSYPSSNIIIQN